MAIPSCPIFGLQKVRDGRRRSVNEDDAYDQYVSWEWYRSCASLSEDPQRLKKRRLTGGRDQR